MDTKKCSKCGAVKSLEEFHRRSKSKDGYKNQCKECRNLQDKTLRDKYRAEKALCHKMARGDHKAFDGIPKRMCPRCKQDKPWMDYPVVTHKNQGINFMCDACGRIAEEVRSRKAKRKINQKRCRERYYAQLKADALSWQNHMRGRGIIWNAGIRKDAAAWREHIKSEGLLGRIR